MYSTERQIPPRLVVPSDTQSPNTHETLGFRQCLSARLHQLQYAVRWVDSVSETDVVVWSCFGVTHNPRVEDWPVIFVALLGIFDHPDTNDKPSRPGRDLSADDSTVGLLHGQPGPGRAVG